MRALSVGHYLSPPLVMPGSAKIAASVAVADVFVRTSAARPGFPQPVASSARLPRGAPGGRRLVGRASSTVQAEADGKSGSIASDWLVGKQRVSSFWKLDDHVGCALKPREMRR